MRMTIDKDGNGEITFTPAEHEARNVLTVEQLLRGLVDADGEPLFDPADIHTLSCAIVSGRALGWIEGGAYEDAVHARAREGYAK